MIIIEFIVNLIVGFVVLTFALAAIGAIGSLVYAVWSTIFEWIEGVVYDIKNPNWRHNSALLEYERLYGGLDEINRIAKEREGE